MEICLGLEEIHSKKIIHRDLKPENIFLTKELQLKIGDFGISKQIKNINEYAKTQVGTLSYMAPEIIKGENYNNKVDIWSLGCIIYELCTLNYCFKSNSIDKLINDINNQKPGKIDSKEYGIWLQNLIDSLLVKDNKKRLNIKEILKIVNNHIIPLDFKKKLIIFEKNEGYQNYLIDQSILNSLDQIEINVLLRENFWNNIKFWTLMSPILPIFSIIVPFISIPIFFSEKYKLFFFKTNMFGFETIIDFLDTKVVKGNKKQRFIQDNSFIINIIKEKIISLIKDKLYENQIKEKLIIFNRENFFSQIQKIKNRILLCHNKKNITKNFNILLLGNTNVGKSTLINEFLKLNPKEKAEEGSGLETKTDEFKPYKGKYNGQTYTLYDTNGITLIGKDSIKNKMESIEKEINKRIEKKAANELIHCIWYCFQGTSIQTADGEFIEKLLNIYTIHNIPIIFVHTKTFNKGDSDTCRKGLIKLLLKIYNKDKVKIKESLDNYINILARGNEKKEEKKEELDEEFAEFYNYNNVKKDNNQQDLESFGLDELEKLSRKEIRIKGIVSSYYEYLKNDIILILTNIIVKLF